ncbi:hexosaminidase [Dysgonomonadaceae bacterium PH5-43]|nr:hexosaminidase [Dysgonomonadaceae bacterium PH5-43]
MKNILVLVSTLLLLISCEKTDTNRGVNIIPAPAEISIGSESFVLNDKVVITFAKPELELAAKYLSECFAKDANITLSVKSDTDSDNAIVLDYDESLNTSDAYLLKVDKQGVSITGANPRSVVLGIQTLRQMLPVDANKETTIPQVYIYDYPEWEWRGMHIDISRHFFNKEEVLEFLDIMAYYKFNKFHWHLTDDQGWRIEIKKYPLLVEKSAWREFDSNDKTCIKKAEKDHNTDYLLPENKMKEVDGKVLYGGYFTQEEIKEVVAYATKLGIDVIPEVDIPGHSSSSIAAYPELSCFGKTGWGEVFSAPLCPGKDNTLEVYKNIYTELFELFPYEYVHVGADEVDMTNWTKCPHCQVRIKKENLKDEYELHSWFVREMEKFFKENGKKLIGWDEIIEGGLSDEATVMWWRTWSRNAVKTATEQGNEVILTPNSHYYFDYQQTHKTLSDLYAYEPIPANMDTTYKHLIKGIQANLWAEVIPSRERQQYMYAPRILALSDVAWRYDKNRNWEEFQTRLLTHFPRLDKMKINYRPLDIPNVHERNVFIGSTEIQWNSPVKGVELRYTTDGTIPDKTSNLYTKPFRINETTEFTIRMFRPDGSAADIIKTVYSKEEYLQSVELKETTDGFNCVWYEGIFNSCNKIETVPVKETYVVESISVPQGVGGKQGLVYTGYIEIPSDDIYTFHLGSDDGSVLYIGDEIVVDNDGPHSPRTLSAQIAMGKGLHPIKLYYFDMNNGGFISLKLFNSKGEEVSVKGKRDCE